MKLSANSTKILESIENTVGINQDQAANMLILLGYETFNDNIKYNQLVEKWVPNDKKPEKRVPKSIPKDKSRLTPIPQHWVEAAEAGEVPPEEWMIEYGQQYGFNLGQIRGIFYNYVNSQVKRGTRWANWKADWQGWVRRQKDFRLSFDNNRGNMRPATFKQL